MRKQIMEFTSVFDEASRDIEAEARERVHTAAVQETTSVAWPFLSLAQSPEEFEHRLALIEDRIDVLASKHGVPCEEITAPLRQGFSALLESRKAAGPDPKVAAEHTGGYGLKATDVVGYTADADTHCVDCAHRIYGDDKGGSDPKHDSEGNQVHPIFGSDEGWQDDHCGSCGKSLQETRRIYSSLVTAGIKCGECGHANPQHSKGAVCPSCGCDSFTARSRTAGLDPDASDDDGDDKDRGPRGPYDDEPYREASRKTAGPAFETDESGKPMRFQCPDCHGQPTTFDLDKGLQTCQGACGGSGTVYRVRRADSDGGYSHKDFDFHPATSRVDFDPHDGFPYPKMSVFEGHIAQVRQALMDGQDPLAWLPQSAPSPAYAEEVGGHDTIEQFEGEPGAAIDKVTSRADAPFGGPR